MPDQHKDCGLHRGYRKTEVHRKKKVPDLIWKRDLKKQFHRRELNPGLPRDTGWMDGNHPQLQRHECT
jgi:hypothetical protein